MGDFAIKIKAVGGHNATEGPCSPQHDEDSDHSCVDCKAAELVDWMRRKGYMISEAGIHHWPASQYSNGDHLDDLLTRKRVR